MSMLFKCDKCGKTMDYKEHYSSTTVYPESEEKDSSCHYDLCPECSKKTKEFIEDFVTRKDINDCSFSVYVDITGDVFKAITGSEIEDKESITIPRETYDSLNRQIAHYDDENKKLWRALDDISIAIAKVNILEGEEEG